MKRWYVAYTKSREEEKAVFHLSCQGYEVYLPRYKKKRRHGRKVDHVLRPLFPRYVFLHIDIEREQWRSVNGTLGVSYFLTEGDAPVVVPKGIVEEIQTRETQEGSVALTPLKLIKGDSLRVTEGAFADSVGILEEVCDEKRVVLLLNLLGRQVRVQAPIDAIAVAS